MFHNQVGSANGVDGNTRAVLINLDKILSPTVYSIKSITF